MKSVLNDFANDTNADLATYVQMYRSRIADKTDEIKDKVAGRRVMREAIATVKLQLGEERKRLEQIEAEQKRRAATSKGASLGC
jgi:hypothetical protein